MTHCPPAEQLDRLLAEELGEAERRAVETHVEGCAECQARLQGRRPVEDHHPAGRANDPFTAPFWANDHDILTDRQHGWSAATLRNPDGSPLLKAAAAIRGWLDVLRLIVERTVGWIPPFLEWLDAALRGSVGDRWWETLGWEGGRA